MARPRRTPGSTVQTKSKWSSGESSTSSPSRRRSTALWSWRGAAGAAVLAVAVYYGALGYLETRVNTPFDGPKVVIKSGLEVPDRYWGTYRSGHYLGLRTRSPQSPLVGLMWYDPDALARSKAGIRHWCDQADGLATYGWLRHDGVSFGEQFIADGPHVLATSLMRTQGGRGGGWTVRIDVDWMNATKRVGAMALVWYVYAEDARVSSTPEHVICAHSEREPYLFNITPVVYRGEGLSWSSGEGRAPGPDILREKFAEMLRAVRVDGGRQIVVTSDQEVQGEDANFVAVQISGKPPFTVDFVYETEGAESLRGNAYSAALDAKKAEFDRRFEAIFRLKEKGYADWEVSAARAAMSNMVGGVSYTYGAGRVVSPHTAEPVPYWRAPLYTAVPSRSFFPRGFLWDEGFHGLLIGRWSTEIQLDIAAHWLDLMNVEGWIPREQILGVEAAARVPKEFIVQSNTAANPPMLLVQLGWLARDRPHVWMAHKDTLRRMMPRLQAWYQWFQTTQRGAEATSYRWRGREDNGVELNPKTLTSGLDDYPRASHPSDVERHVDLRCWMFAAADAMAHLARVLDLDTSRYEATRDSLADEDLLNQLHWSDKAGMYADYGLHTDGVELARAVRRQNDPAPPALVRVVSTPPREQLVTSAYGYVSLFPLLLRVLSPQSEKLGRLLSDLDRPELLWSPYGLRSLAKSAPLYMRRNTEHDPPYWRGQVWLNVNYLALAALRHYAGAPGPHAARAGDLHRRLRENLVRAVLGEYRRTGYYWEQYSGEDGRGSGCRPFTGWTALVVLIMSDQY